MIVFTKLDLLPPDTDVPALVAPDARALLAISAVTRRGLEPLTERLFRLIAEARAE